MEHLTTNLSNLSLYSKYQGFDDVMIGDGSTPHITHTGSTTIPTSSRTFTLQNVFCILSMQKNLVSIYQFYITNHISVKFSPSAFQVKDINTGAILLMVNLMMAYMSGQLHPLQLPLYRCLTTSSEWHSRLGHPSFTIMKNIISKFSLPLSSLLSSSTHCNACSCNKSHKILFSSSILTLSHLLELIFSDVWTSPIYSVDGFQYYVIFIDYYI